MIVRIIARIECLLKRGLPARFRFLTLDFKLIASYLSRSRLKHGR